MIIRLGYVAMSQKLKNCSPSQTITLGRLNKIAGNENKIYKLRAVTRSNLNNTMRILYHTIANGIYLYRFTSKLVPLATHPATEGWDYIEDCREEFIKIGTIVKKHGLRVSAHPDHFTLLNSTRKEVIKKSIADLLYHHRILEGMGLDGSAKLVMHVGSNQGGKEASLKRFQKNFLDLPAALQNRLVLENDDRQYTAEDVLELCNKLKLPMVLDFHHYKCCNRGENISRILPDIFHTWNASGLPPKMHISSSRNNKNPRSHADDINLKDFFELIELILPLGKDVDIMIEAKNKDLAVFNLVQKLKLFPDFHFKENGVILL